MVKTLLRTCLVLVCAAFAIECNAQVTSSDPQTRYRDTDVGLTAGGLWRIRFNGGAFTLEKNTDAAGGFATSVTPLTVGVTGQQTLGVKHAVAGTLSSAAGLQVSLASITGGGAITDSYGAFFEKQTVGTNNWNVWSGPLYSTLEATIGQTLRGISRNVFVEKDSTVAADVNYAAYGYNESNTASVGNGGVVGLGVSTHTTGTKAWLQGLVGRADVIGIGNVTDAAGVIAVAGKYSASGTVTNLIGFKFDGFYSVIGTITNGYGLYLSDVAGATNNYAIRSGAGLVQFGDRLQISASTFSSLPTCNSGNEGMMRPITDASSATFAATITGGGANHVIAYCNGTAWTAR